MKVPNVERASVAMGKLDRYLLSGQHPLGRSKAVFFRRFGFAASNPTALQQALLMHAGDNEVVSSRPTLYGISYAVEGPFHTPDGRQPWVRSVWFIDAGAENPRFISAYPP